MDSSRSPLDPSSCTRLGGFTLKGGLQNLDNRERIGLPLHLKLIFLPSGKRTREKLPPLSRPHPPVCGPSSPGSHWHQKGRGRWLGYLFAHPPLPLPSRSHLQQGLGVGAQAGAASTAGPWELLKSHWGKDLPAVSSTEGTPGGFLISSNGRTCGGGVAQGANSCLQPGLGPVLPLTSPTSQPPTFKKRYRTGLT